MKNFIKINVIFLTIFAIFSSTSLAADRILPIPKPTVEEEVKKTTAKKKEIYPKQKPAIKKEEKEIEQVQEVVPDSKVEFANQSNKDFRSYKVDFDKIAKVLNFKTKWNLKDGIKQLYDVFIKEKFSESDFRDKKFHRINQLKWLIEEGHLDEHFKIN